ncbi:MAG TPA: hypothetical protein DHU33_04810 [Firmicutes bacterium]|nr:hypothetical protein [Bacillota bacterium]
MSWYLKRKIFQKRNIVMMIILMFLLLISFFGLTITWTIFNYKNNLINKNYEYRTLTINQNEDNINDDILKVGSIENVAFVGSTKYLNGSIVKVKDFDVDDLRGSIQIFPLIPGRNIKSSYDENTLEEGKIICPKKFYPYSLALSSDADNFDMGIVYSKVLNGSDYIGKKVDIKSESGEQNYQFEIVGTYNQNESLNSINTCLVNIKDYDKLASPYSGIGYGVDNEGNEIVDYYEYEGLMVLVDKLDNISKVKSKLIELGYNAENYFVLDNQSVFIYIYIPLLICLIVLIVCINIIYNFIVKKTKEKLRIYGIQSAVGFDNKLILNLDIWENIIVYGISFIFSFVIYYIVLQILIRTLLYEFVYNSVSIVVPVMLISVYFGVLLLFIVFVNRRLVTNILKRILVDC